MKPDNWNRFAAGLLAILLCLCSFSILPVGYLGQYGKAFPALSHIQTIHPEFGSHGTPP